MGGGAALSMRLLNSTVSVGPAHYPLWFLIFFCAFVTGMIVLIVWTAYDILKESGGKRR
jgi:hypothetical protein